MRATRRIGVVVTVLVLASGAWWWSTADSDPPPEAWVEPDVTVLTGAIRFFETKLQEDPANFLAARKLVDRYQARFAMTARMEDVRRAEDLARRLLDTDADTAGTRGRLASIALARHDFPLALEHAEAAVDAAPDDPRAWSGLFDAALAVGRYDRAEAALTRIAPGSLARHVKESTWLAARGESAAAGRRLTRACRRIATWSRPQVEAWCWTELAGIELDHSGPRAAIALYRHALALVPGYRGAVEGLAALAYAEGELAEAEALYRRIETDAHADLYLRLAEIRSARGDLEEARLWERAFLDVALRPEGEALFAEPLVYLLAAMESTVEEAILVAERNVERRPTVEAWDALAWARLRGGRLPGALEASERAFRWGEPSLTMKVHRARILAAMGEDRTAPDLTREIEEEVEDRPWDLAPHLRPAHPQLRLVSSSGFVGIPAPAFHYKRCE